jgi:hypothetical protein
MSSGYGSIRFRGVDGDSGAVREAVRKVCVLVAEHTEFDIEIEMIDIDSDEEE